MGLGFGLEGVRVRVGLGLGLGLEGVAPFIGNAAVLPQ